MRITMDCKGFLGCRRVKARRERSGTIMAIQVVEVVRMILGILIQDSQLHRVFIYRRSHRARDRGLLKVMSCIICSIVVRWINEEMCIGEFGLRICEEKLQICSFALTLQTNLS